MSDASARLRSALEWRAPGRAAPTDRLTPQEVAVGLSFDGRPHTVLMATPAQVEDLARGFTITEGVARADEIVSVEARTEDLGILVDVRLSEGVVRRKARPRNLEGRSSCGLCGVQQWSQPWRQPVRRGAQSPSGRCAGGCRRRAGARQGSSPRREPQASCCALPCTCGTQRQP
jgi:formate dehydrogenase assembly factor FdhD